LLADDLILSHDFLLPANTHIHHSICTIISTYLNWLVYVCALLAVRDHRVYLLQMLFMCYALGGPQAWKGKNMYEAHKALNLTEEHFNAVAGHFIATLQVGWFIQSLSCNHVGVAWPPSPGIFVHYNSMQLVRSYV
jgi:hypothetical protein